MCWTLLCLIHTQLTITNDRKRSTSYTFSSLFEKYSDMLNDAGQTFLPFVKAARYLHYNAHLYKLGLWSGMVPVHCRKDVGCVFMNYRYSFSNAGNFLALTCSYKLSSTMNMLNECSINLSGLEQINQLQ